MPCSSRQSLHENMHRSAQTYAEMGLRKHSILIVNSPRDWLLFKVASQILVGNGTGFKEFHALQLETEPARKFAQKRLNVCRNGFSNSSIVFSNSQLDHFEKVPSEIWRKKVSVPLNFMICSAGTSLHGNVSRNVRTNSEMRSKSLFDFVCKQSPGPLWTKNALVEFGPKWYRFDRISCPAAEIWSNMVPI